MFLGKPYVPFEQQYAESLYNLYHLATNHPEQLQGDRTGTGTWKITEQQFSFDLLLEPLPILHCKKVNFNSALIEMLWIMSGNTNTKYLKDNGVNYWDEWADENGDLGEVYGHQMRNFNGTDQLADLIDGLLNNFTSRRHIINLWNPSRLKFMKLPACHYLYQFVTYTAADGSKYADLVVHQRSGDSFLGIPYDFLLFTIFGKMIARYCGFTLRNLNISVADYHIYSNHVDAVKKYLYNFQSLESDNKFLNYLKAPLLNHDSYKDSNFKPEIVFDKSDNNEIPSVEGFMKELQFFIDNPQVIKCVGYDGKHDGFIKAQVAV